MTVIRHVPRNPVGFTLVELLVVIGIISVLISILLPALNKARASAKTVQCASNMKQVMLGLMMYAQDYKGSFPLLYSQTNPSSDKIFWAGLIGGDTAGYVGDPRAFFCPDRIDKGKYGDVVASLVKSHPVSNGPDTRWNYVSYGMGHHSVSILDTDMAAYSEHPIKLGQPGAPASNFAVLFESYEPADALNPAKNYYGLREVQVGKQAIWVHSGDITNVAYLDGHVSAEPASALGWNAKSSTWMAQIGGVSQATWKKGPPWYYMQFTK